MSPIDVTEPGMETEAREEHPENAYFPIDVTEPGMETEAREEHPENALSPRDVTEPGMETEAREEQPSNERSPMDATPGEILADSKRIPAQGAPSDSVKSEIPPLPAIRSTPSSTAHLSSPTTPFDRLLALVQASLKPAASWPCAAAFAYHPSALSADAGTPLPSE